MNPKDLGALMVLGAVYKETGDLGKAQQAFEQALAVNPRFAPAANNLAWLLSEQGGDKERALQLAQTAKGVAPDDPSISDTLGWILYKRGVYQQATALLRESAAKRPESPEIQYHLGMASLKSGDADTARTALSRAVSSPASFPGKDEAKQALATLK